MSEHNKLVLPSLILAGLTVTAGLFLAFVPSRQIYLLFLLPFGLIAALLARIALNQIQRSGGTPQDRTLALVAYFLGFLPGLYFCVIFTYQLITLWR